MKKFRLPLIIFICTLIVLLVIGAFFDFEISSFLAIPRNIVYTCGSIIGIIIGYACLAFIAGGLFRLGLNESRIGYKFILFVLSLVSMALTIYYSGREYFGPNGFDIPKLSFIGYIIAVLSSCAIAWLGFNTFKDGNAKYAWIYLALVLVVFLLSSGIGVMLLKGFYHRPRFRTIILGDVPFYAFGKRCTEYLEYMENFNILKEEFKSFPSGHSAVSALTIALAILTSCANEKVRKHQNKLLIISIVITACTMLFRILAGAHFLTDVSVGALLTVLCCFVFNEVTIIVDQKSVKTIEDLEK